MDTFRQQRPYMSSFIPSSMNRQCCFADECCVVFSFSVSRYARIIYININILFMKQEATILPVIHCDYNSDDAGVMAIPGTATISNKLHWQITTSICVHGISFMMVCVWPETLHYLIIKPTTPWHLETLINWKPYPCDIEAGQKQDAGH